MAYQQFSNGWQVGTTSAVDRRLYLTKKEMRGDPNGTGEYTDFIPRWLVKNSSTGLLEVKKIPMPNPYFTMCQDDRKLYIYYKAASETPSAETGYFTPLATELAAGENGQILMYTNDQWQPVKFEDNQSIVYSTMTGLTLKGLNEATAGQVLSKKADGSVEWKKASIDPAEIVDGKTIVYLADSGIQINGFLEATTGQMLVKGADGKTSWVAPASMEALNQAVVKAETAANNARLAERNCEAWYDALSDKIWFGTIDEYNALTEIYEDSIYIILDGKLPTS